MSSCVCGFTRWLYTEVEFFGDTWKSNYGLWSWCRETIEYSGESQSTCRRFTNPEEYVSTTRMLLVFGLLIVFVGVVLSCLQKFCMRDLAMLSFIGALVTIIGATFSWIGLMTYTRDFVKIAGQTPDDIYPAFWMTLISVLLELTAGGLFAFRKGRKQVAPAETDTNGDVVEETNGFRRNKTWDYDRFKMDLY